MRLQSSRTFPPSSFRPHPSSLQPSFDGGYIVGGLSSRYDGTSWLHQGHVVKFDARGSAQWQRLTDGGFAVATYATRNAASSGVKVIRLASDGTTRWDLSAITTHGGTVRTILPTSDGGFVVGYSSYSFDYVSAPYIAKVNADGTWGWTRSYPELATARPGFMLAGMIERIRA